ncbi:hypothetical protein bbp_015 [Buchnera aphidicola str. Bp (Baizongia pistaciae)]|uniref:Putative membrane protein insertion efficiency factor n=1 Tax=Buchnera aphidicola subsp. Baizongia pistaciae (strain Bp) TaxID=224915 RepID=YIDD_BUCBP|nr:membrane protein insertion efficiency factor YidD [Buchnera aphidicola]P59471.1 RecName: Full=Putative membrane protein insertion efficiency factor [Buchnera aphidicola str. Bp (Baizongia pistaciae)]AAO26759.1 hypothetical protein bbp_015 [Buchnera aphidicola str. Bp (Baizongia pistaciae)]
MVLLLSMISRCLILIILCYQRYISVFLSPRCRFYPTCSHYAVDALYTFGLLKGLLLIAKRILKCHPFHSGGLNSISIKTKSKREY